MISTADQQVHVTIMWQ